MHVAVAATVRVTLRIASVIVYSLYISNINGATHAGQRSGDERNRNTTEYFLVDTGGPTGKLIRNDVAEYIMSASLGISHSYASDIWRERNIHVLELVA